MHQSYLAEVKKQSYHGILTYLAVQNKVFAYQDQYVMEPNYPLVEMNQNYYGFVKSDAEGGLSILD